MDGQKILRAGGLNYICDEVHTAMAAGVPVEGVCLYPICNYPGWDDERCCHTELWSYADEQGARELHQPLTEELQRQQRFFAISAWHRTSKQLVTGLEKPIKKSGDTRPVICLFTDSFDPSGMGKHMLILAAQLQDRYQILFVCPPGENGDHFLNSAEALGCIALPLTVQGNRTAAKLLQWWLRELAVEIFHTAYLCWAVPRCIAPVSSQRSRCLTFPFRRFTSGCVGGYGDRWHHRLVSQAPK